MNRISTVFLKGVLILIGIAALLGCFAFLPSIAREELASDANLVALHYIFLIGAYAAAVPFFIALFQAFRLLSHIEKGQPFSLPAVKAVQYIRYCTLVISAIIIAATISIIVFTRGDRAGFIALGIYITFGTIVVATFATVLQKLLQNAVDIKSENDLTV